MEPGTEQELSRLRDSHGFPWDYYSLAAIAQGTDCMGLVSVQCHTPTINSSPEAIVQPAGSTALRLARTRQNPRGKT